MFAAWSAWASGAGTGVSARAKVVAAKQESSSRIAAIQAELWRVVANGGDAAAEIGSGLAIMGRHYNRGPVVRPGWSGEGRSEI